MKFIVIYVLVLIPFHLWIVACYDSSTLFMLVDVFES